MPSLESLKQEAQKPNHELWNQRREALKLLAESGTAVLKASEARGLGREVSQTPPQEIGQAPVGQVIEVQYNDQPQRIDVRTSSHLN